MSNVGIVLQSAWDMDLLAENWNERREARFLAAIEVDPLGCWLWTRCLDSKGYGRVNILGKPLYAHRIAFWREHHFLANGFQIDHRCHGARLDCCVGGPGCEHRRCVNPAHLDQVSPAENSRRAVRDFCRRGHPRRGNTDYYRGGDGRLRPICLVCRDLRLAARAS